MMEVKANEFGKTLDKNNQWKCSRNWMKRFRKRHHICWKTSNGEAADADASAAEDFIKNKFPKISRGYLPHQVYNADESGLYFQAQIRKTITLKKVSCRGRKKKLQRFCLAVHQHDRNS